jgi:arginyl-tRNA--protein-N-Asp/Glu arginylyltransferase
MAYLKWDTKVITDFTPQSISEMYNKGFVFTRSGKGIMNQTRSLRIDLSKFELHTENRRVLRKTEGLEISTITLPMSEADYSWEIHKLGKEYYNTKFGEGVFSASKIKELILDGEKSNYNHLCCYREKDSKVGYAICYENQDIMHYAYPFYDLTKYANNFGMGMMLRAILYAQQNNKKYVYIGSASRRGDSYKLYFNGLEWFDGKDWSSNISELKDLIATQQETA